MIGLLADTKNLPINQHLFMHGTRSTVLVYMNHLGDLEPGIYSTGTLYKRHIYPMSGPLGGDLTSTRENVGLEVVSGLIGKIDRNVYYTKYGETHITLESLADDLAKMIKRKAYLYKFAGIFGYISRVRYWDDAYYKKHFEKLIIDEILPVIKRKMDNNPIIQEAINHVILAKDPVIKFTEEDKLHLNETYPMILGSSNVQVIPAGKSIETDEMYTKQLLLKDVSIVYTTRRGYNFVRSFFPHVICSDELFYDDYRLTFLPGQLLAKQMEWKYVFPFLNDEDLEKLEKSGVVVSDFNGSSIYEAREVLGELINYKFSDEQIKRIIFYYFRFVHKTIVLYTTTP